MYKLSQSIFAKTFKYIGRYNVQAMTMSCTDFRSCSLQESASYDFHDIATTRDNDIGTIPKRALLETNRRRDALSSTMSHSSRRSVGATERGSVLPERAVRCPLLHVIVLVRPITDCIISCLYSLLRRSARREQNRMPREETTCIAKYAPILELSSLFSKILQ